MKIFASIDEFAACVGGEIATSEWVEVTQNMIDRFADITGDDQWIHVDPERCQAELGTDTIAHGYLVLSLITGLSPKTYRIEGKKRVINYGSNKVRFINPVSPGARLRARYELKEFAQDKDRWRSTSQVIMEIEGADRPALVAETMMLFYV